ncbi:hypothetical protein PRZ48_007511 [Zasmidium cellare]|uniref:Uncharacterized protein n=1 Tax=Zasmidium cellare TaxID=395010 RepID=A0ABR0EJR9_ZASCE|nr:hypothetical protein PRZ48_007511 [Zasmidium cellare]
MANGKVDWDSQATWQRVIAAILATGVKVCIAPAFMFDIKLITCQVDLKQTAMYFGTTYDTLENRFRKIKKESATLKEEVERGERGEIAPTRTKSNPATPRKATPKKQALSAVTNGRVAKTTPSKNRKAGSIKREMSDDGFASTLASFTTGEDFSFESSDANAGLIGYNSVTDDDFGINGFV